MGRDERVRVVSKLATPGRVRLPEAAFWKFRAAVNDVFAIEVEASQAVARFKARASDARDRTTVLFSELGKAHGFDPTKTYGWDDSTCELIEVPKE